MNIYSDSPFVVVRCVVSMLIILHRLSIVNNLCSGGGGHVHDHIFSIILCSGCGGHFVIVHCGVVVILVCTFILYCALGISLYTESLEMDKNTFIK